ncbi:unnamed protein product [Cylindrotheca closterium]|uniref:Uncharacterized protein n=1 Tax=Cylindrotheca closterium TaxID=2856 RepID=A0AAD2PXK2_9STRA|nr:unnamed protein product [Cylindrotheca closterium]
MKYKDEVLGKRIEVEFKVGTVTQFFPGTIQKLKMELSDGIISCHHFIAFDDEDEYWFDLEKKETANQLRWPEKENIPQPDAKKLKTDDASSSIPQFPIIVLQEG